MENNKSPGNDGFLKEFYKCFWDENKKPFLASIHKAFLKQAVIKTLGKKGKDKIFIKNWRPVSMLNTDMKIFFIFVKNNPEATGLNIFKHEFLYTDYADETTFFLKDRKSIIELMKDNLFKFLRI